MSLSVLLDYRLEDNKEHSFEVRSTADNEDREIIKWEIRFADVLCLFFFWATQLCVSLSFTTFSCQLFSIFSNNYIDHFG